VRLLGFPLDVYQRATEAFEGLQRASPPEAVAFRRWYLGEFTAQLQGEPPLPWPQADHATLVRDARLRGRTGG
jgi:uncharacterized protein YfaT (DUF1175 family)